jgi:O-antigen/teichoic acid export membrane protein
MAVVPDTAPPQLSPPAPGRSLDYATVDVRDPRDAMFDTDHLRGDLKARTVKAGIVTGTSQVGKFALRLGSTAILARLLTPAEFGLVAMVTVITGFVEMFKDIGLSTATVQKARITHAEVSTLFWINVGLGFFASLTIAALAPFNVWFYGKPELFWITIVIAGSAVFGGTAAQLLAILRRRMEFGRLAVIELSGMVVPIGLACVMAWRGWSYWSLVALVTAGPVVVAGMSFALCRWVPSRPSNISIVADQLRMGMGISGAGLLGYTRETFARILIGKFFSPVELGTFSRAQDLLQMPLRQAMPPITAVLVPALSRLQNEPARYRAAFRKVFTLALLVTYPFVLVCMGCPTEFVRVFLGPQWDAAVPILQSFSLLALAMVPASTGATALTTMGRSTELFRWNFTSLVITIVCVAVAIPWGVNAVAFAVGASSLFLRTPVFFRIVIRVTPLTTRDLWTPMFAFGVACAVAVGVARLVTYVMADFAVLTRLIVGFSAALVTYGLVVLCFRVGRDAVGELKTIAREAVARRRRKLDS